MSPDTPTAWSARDGQSRRRGRSADSVSTQQAGKRREPGQGNDGRGGRVSDEPRDQWTAAEQSPDSDQLTVGRASNGDDLTVGRTSDSADHQAADHREPTAEPTPESADHQAEQAPNGARPTADQASDSADHNAPASADRRAEQAPDSAEHKAQQAPENAEHEAEQAPASADQATESAGSDAPGWSTPRHQAPSATHGLLIAGRVAVALVAVVVLRSPAGNGRSSPARIPASSRAACKRSSATIRTSPPPPRPRRHPASYSGREHPAAGLGHPGRAANGEASNSDASTRRRGGQLRHPDDRAHQRGPAARHCAVHPPRHHDRRARPASNGTPRPASSPTPTTR